MEPLAVATAVAVVAGTIFAGAKLFAGKPPPAVPDYAPLTKAYDEIVNNLREEVARVVEDNQRLHVENREMRARIGALERTTDGELQELRDQVAELTRTVDDLRTENAALKAVRGDRDS